MTQVALAGAHGSRDRYLADLREFEVSKAGDWKTIKQREDEKRRNRRIINRGLGAAGVGSALYGLGYDAEDRAATRIRHASHRELGHRMPYLRASWGSPAGKLKVIGLGTGIAGVTAMAGGGSANLYQQRKINDRRKANAARAQERSAVLDEVSRNTLARDGHLFRESIDPDSGLIMERHSGYKVGPGGRPVKVGKSEPLRSDPIREAPAGYYGYLLPTIREYRAGIPDTRRNPISPLQQIGASNLVAEGTRKVRSINPFFRRRRTEEGVRMIAMGTQMMNRGVGEPL